VLAFLAPKRKTVPSVPAGARWPWSSRLASPQPQEVGCLHRNLRSSGAAPREAAPSGGLGVVRLARLGPSRGSCLVGLVDGLYQAIGGATLMGRRQAGLGTLVPRTPTVAHGPKARSDLASRRSLRQGRSAAGPNRLRVMLTHGVCQGVGISTSHAASATARLDNRLGRADKPSLFPLRLAPDPLSSCQGHLQI
jgi:hypothetical protein